MILGRNISALMLLSLFNSQSNIDAFAPSFTSNRPSSDVSFLPITTVGAFPHSTLIINTSQLKMSSYESFDLNNEDDENEDEDEDDEDEDSLYEQFASSEFSTEPRSGSSSSEITNYSASPPLGVDWGGEYDTLRSRSDDVKEGLVGPSRALFRMMTAESPNDAIANFVKNASPEMVTTMSSAVKSLLGGLVNPSAGVETIVKANGDKLGALCFQLQMTGYMFRNAEYVIAIRDLMDISGSAGLDDYKRAFDKLDKDGSGFIETAEIEILLSDVYDEGEMPAFEVDTFLQFFDANNDGKISWEEFERGFGVVAEQKRNAKKSVNIPPVAGVLPGSADDDDEDDDEDIEVGEPTVSGLIEIEMKNGQIVKVEAKEYILELKREAEALKAALSRETRGEPSNNQAPAPMGFDASGGEFAGIAAYISSRQGDIQSLTKGISPEVVDAMKMLVDFVLDANSDRDARAPDEELVMEIPGSALQHLALWQLVLGYKLRESEATGEYRRMLE